MYRLIGIAVILMFGMGAAGCARTPALEVAKISDISTPAGTRGIDVYASRRDKGEEVPNLAGDQVVYIRTYVSKKGTFGNETAGKEFAGANCQVSSRYFSARVTSPGAIRVPVYRQYSSPVSVSCQKDGFHSKTASFKAYNKTKSDRQQAVSNSGSLVVALVGTLAVSAINAASDENTHEFIYPMAVMKMRSTAQPKPVAKKAMSLGGTE